MIVTAFLAVLTLALLIGNAFLFFIPKKPKNHAPGTARTYQPQIIPAQETRDTGTTSQAVKTLVFEERINLLNKRIARLEETSLQQKNPSDFREFKNNTRIEIEALKQRLSSLRKELNLEPDDLKKKPYEEISNEKIQALVYRQ